MRYLLVLTCLFLAACAQNLTHKEVDKRTVSTKKEARTPAETDYRRSVVVHTDQENAKKFKGYDTQDVPSYGPSELPPPQVRQAIFEEAGLLPLIQKMDALDQDLFYLKALKYSVKKLKHEYPGASNESLLRLMELSRLQQQEQK